MRLVKVCSLCLRKNRTSNVFKKGKGHADPCRTTGGDKSELEMCFLATMYALSTFIFCFNFSFFFRLTFCFPVCDALIAVQNRQLRTQKSSKFFLYMP